MIFCTECSTLEEMAVESMTVHPNSPTANHEHNSLLTDERSSNIIIFLSNYWFVLCFFQTQKARGICFFLSKGLKSPFWETYRGNETPSWNVTQRNLEGHTRIRKNINNIIIFVFSVFSVLLSRRPSGYN